MKRPTILLIAIFISLVSMAEKRFQIGDFCYQIISETDKTVAVFSCATTATDITIPEKVSDNGSEYSVTTIGIPDFITAIEESGFDKCENLQSVSIPPSVSKIEEGAFWGCKTLKSVHIPHSVTSISVGAFSDCTAIQDIIVDSNNMHYQSIDGVLFDKKATTLLFYPRGKKQSSYSIPNSVTTVGEYAFWQCKTLQSISIPNSVTAITPWAFCHCSALVSIDIPNSVKTIGKQAFDWCSSLQSVSIPNSVTTIEDCAFSCCSALKSITIPGSVTTIGRTVFLNCSALENIMVDDNNQHYKSIDGVLFNKDATTLVSYPHGKPQSSYSIPRSVTTIGKEAFWQCERLHSVNIPNSVTLIEEGAFTRCFNLQSIAIPNSVTAIQPYTFSLCTALQTVYIPDSVTSIGNGSFLHCNSLKEIINLADEPQPLDENAFDYTQFISIRLLVKPSCVEKFKKANIWKKFSSIEPTHNSN